MPKALPPEDPAAVPLEAWTATFGAIELLAVDQAPVITDPDRGPRRQAWVRAREQLGDDPVLNACALAYVSDIRLAGTAAMRHKPGQRFGPAVSLDHAIWFHRPFRLDEWLLFDVESPSYSSARGLARGEFYTRDGILVASVTQESLSRVLG
jgi:acyl-CoA thioesterase-2